MGPTYTLCFMVPKITNLLTLELRVMLVAVVQSNMFGLKQQALVDQAIFEPFLT